VALLLGEHDLSAEPHMFDADYHVKADPGLALANLYRRLAPPQGAIEFASRFAARRDTLP
jgi:hypothetical protein